MQVNPNTFDPRSIVTKEDTKFCTLPGQEAITLSTIHGGHGCRIGETPRTVPLFFHQEALAKGAYTEEQLNDLTARLAGSTTPVVLTEPDLTLAQTAAGQSLDADNDGFTAPPGAPSQNADRTEQIKAAVIDLINCGNPADFTSSGSPKVESLKDKLGFDVTGPERDAAFEAAKG
jgi:hypothetical protein